jgi:hypothetical protein
MTKAKETHISEAGFIDDLLADVAQAQPSVDETLMAKVLADANRMQMQHQHRPTPTAPSLWVQFQQAIGGWPALSGLVATGVVGIWIGVAPPDGLTTYTSTLMGTTETVDLLGLGLDDLFEEIVDG